MFEGFIVSLGVLEGPITAVVACMAGCFAMYVLHIWTE